MYNKQSCGKLSSVPSLETKYFPQIYGLTEVHIINIAVVVNCVSFASDGYKLVPFVLASRDRLLPWRQPTRFQMRRNCPRATEAQITGTWRLLNVVCNSGEGIKCLT